MRRALVLRLTVLVLTLGSVAALASTAKPAPPWAQLMTFFGVFGLVVVAVSIRSDRRLLTRAGRGSAPWTGSNARWTQIFLSVNPDQARNMAERAIRAIGGNHVEWLDENTAIGWIGWVLTNLPEWQQYQLAIVISPGPGGGLTFTCCARPRASVALMGASKGQRLASALRSELEALNPGPSID
jgi:hypothetical protein